VPGSALTKRKLYVHERRHHNLGSRWFVALIRAFARASGRTIGNFWVDLTRCTLYVLLPISIVGALILVWQGVPQNLGPYVDATNLEGARQQGAVP